MNASASIRLASLTVAALVSLGLFSLVAQSLHVERFGDGARLVSLEQVVVTAARTLGTEVAAAPRATRTN